MAKTTKTTEELRAMAIEMKVAKWGEDERTAVVVEMTKRNHNQILAWLYNETDDAQYAPKARYAKRVSSGAADDGVS